MKYIKYIPWIIGCGLPFYLGVLQSLLFNPMSWSMVLWGLLTPTWCIVLLSYRLSLKERNSKWT